jgi:hypothetical protein
MVPAMAKRALHGKRENPLPAAKRAADNGASNLAVPSFAGDMP